MFFRDVLFLSQPLKRESDMSELVSNDDHYCDASLLPYKHLSICHYQLYLCVFYVGGYLMDGCDDNGSDRFRICQKLWETVQMNTEVFPQMRLLTFELSHSFINSFIRLFLFLNKCIFFHR